MFIAETLLTNIEDLYEIIRRLSFVATYVLSHLSNKACIYLQDTVLLTYEWVNLSTLGNG